MSTLSHMFRFVGRNNDKFKPYYEKENNLRRLAIIHSVAAFVISPLFALFIHLSEGPEVYVYLGLSYVVLFPLYLLICWSVTFFRKRMMYFFLVHLFGVTLFAYQSLYTNGFETQELFCFFGLYALICFGIQRLYPTLLYGAFVMGLVIHGFQVLDNIYVPKTLMFGMFFVIAFASSVVAYVRLRSRISVVDYSTYLKQIMNNPGWGYILFDFHENQLNLIDFNNEAARELNVVDANLENVSERLLSFMSDKDMESIKKLKVGRKFVKTIHYYRYNTSHYVELNVIVLSLKNGMYWLTRIYDVTEEIKKREELESNERKYRNLYYRNKAGVFTINQDTKIINGNDAFFEMFDETVRIGDKLFQKEQFGEWEFISEVLEAKQSIQSYQTQLTLVNGANKIFIFSWYLDEQTSLIEGSVIDLTNIQRASQALKQSEEKYRSIYEESNDAILLLDDDKVIDVNRRAIQLFGKSESELLDANLFDLSIDQSEESKNVYHNHREKLRNIRSIKFDWLFDGNNRTVEAEVSLVEIILEDQLYYQCVIHDRTDYNRNLREIERNRRNLEKILENNPEGILIVRKGKLLYQNSEIANIIGNNFQLNNLFTPDDQERFDALYELQNTSKMRQNIQLELRGKSGEVVPVDVTMVSTSYEDKEATLIIIKDISVQNTLAKEKLRAELAEETNKKLADEIMERIKAEKLLQEQFLRTKAILDSSSNTFLLTLTHDHRISSYNTHCESYFYQQFGINIREDIYFRDFFHTIFSATQLRYFGWLINSVKRGASRQFEVQLDPDNRDIWFEIFMSPIFDTEGTVAEISIVAHDISEKKKSDIEIVESLKEKEVLLKEIHHRVKNNLQVISSILNLQSSFVHDENTLGILQESRNRIRSMAIIHENLYRTEDFSSINFASYLQNLTANLVASYRIHDEVVLISDLDDIDLILDQAIPCGLLVNELITNSLKYAWKPGQKGTITLELKEHGEQVQLYIADDGIGLPAKFEDINSDTLGLQLVVTLVEQLDGELTVKVENGTKYLIKFDNIKSNPNVED